MFLFVLGLIISHPLQIKHLIKPLVGMFIYQMSLRGSSLAASYSISKSALTMLTSLMALVELGKHKLRVNLVCPGGFNTDLTLKTMDGISEWEKEWKLEAGKQYDRRHLENRWRKV